MRLNKSFALATLILVTFSCQKTNKDESVTRPVEFTETSYQTMGTFDNFGKPNYLVTKDAISSELQSFINTNLPEHTDLRTSHPELLSSTAIADIAITKQSDVFITFVSQGTGLTDAIAFYTYPTNTHLTSPKDIKTITYFFPNAGAGTILQPGDKVKLGRFDVGVSIGFVLLQNAWSTASHDLDNKAVHFCSNDVLNPEVDIALKKHAVLINYASENKVLIGFEDLDRTKAECDNDFNDVVLYATVTP
jgi:hypothetical protein